ncbi:hypothetical protein PROFUN_15527, partial [Planoprotostelium fungivorum]
NQPPIMRISFASEYQKSTSDRAENSCIGGSEINLRPCRKFLHRRFRNQPPIGRKFSAPEKSTSDCAENSCIGGSEINLRPCRKFLHRRFRNQTPILGVRKSSATEVQKSTSDRAENSCIGVSEINLRSCRKSCTSERLFLYSLGSGPLKKTPSSKMILIVLRPCLGRETMVCIGGSEIKLRSCGKSYASEVQKSTSDGSETNLRWTSLFVCGLNY